MDYPSSIPPGQQEIIHKEYLKVKQNCRYIEESDTNPKNIPRNILQNGLTILRC